MKILRRLFLALATAVGAFVLALLCLSIVASIRFYSDRDQAISTGPAATSSEAHLRISDAERQRIAAEHPAYYSRRKEQTYLTLAEWAQVYSYNEFGDFLASGGRQTDFPFASAIRSFWSSYFLSLDKSKSEEFNWPYNFVSWVIGINLTVEYGVKFVYENTVGRLTQSIAGSDTEADRFIAKSWNNYAKTLYQTSWYHYPYFADLQEVWRETALFDPAIPAKCGTKDRALGVVSDQRLIRPTMALERRAKGKSDIQHRACRRPQIAGRHRRKDIEGIERQPLPDRNRKV